MSSTLFYIRFGLACLLIQGMVESVYFLPKQALTNWMESRKFVCFCSSIPHMDMGSAEER
jgi:hypothetical protein